MDLQVQGHLADFVEEDGAAVGHLEFADTAAPLGTGEGTVRIAKELAGHQFLRDSAAVDGHIGAVSSAAGIVDGLGQDILAGTALPQEQYRCITAGCRLGHGDAFSERWTFADDIIEGQPGHSADITGSDPLGTFDLIENED